MKEVLSQVIDGKHLTSETAERAMELIMAGRATASQIGSLLTALRMKGETPEEIAAFARVMRRFAIHVVTENEQVVDTCGTGGDGADTFNISTAAAIVTAAAGIPVAKHGNRAMSGKTGSADVLQALGVSVELDGERAARCLREVGVCFMFAPQYHQAMKHAVGPRKELGFRTIFNVLGPLANPAGAKRQVIGTYDASLVDRMAEALRMLGTTHALIVHGDDGLDEITLSTSTQIAEIRDGRIQTYTLTPEHVGIQKHPVESFRGGDAAFNAQIIRRIFAGEQGAPRDIVVMNAAAAIYVGGKVNTISDGVRVASAAIDGGHAQAVLERLAKRSHELAGEERIQV